MNPATTAVADRLSKVGHITHEFDDTEQQAITRYLRRVVDVYRASLPPTMTAPG